MLAVSRLAVSSDDAAVSSSACCPPRRKKRAGRDVEETAGDEGFMENDAGPAAMAAVRDDALRARR